MEEGQLPNSYDSPFRIVEAIVPHLEQAKKNNLWQFQEKSNLESLMGVFFNQIDKIHRDVTDIQSALPIDYTEFEQGAYGAFLDLLGKELGRGRRDIESDDLVYKDYLFAQVLENTNQGTLDEFLAITAKKLRSEIYYKKVYATEIYPAQVHATVSGVDNVVELGENSGINKLLPAGVGNRINVFPDDGCIPFGFEGSGGLGLPAIGDTSYGCMVARYLKGPNKGIVPFALDNGTDGGKGLDTIEGDDHGQFVTLYTPCQ